MSNFKPLDWYWLVWLGLFFLLPELLAVFNVIPLDTFSGTTSLAESSVPLVRFFVFGFGVGLVGHLTLGTPFFRAMLGGALGAAAAFFLYKHGAPVK